jgi:hypothetical protein
MIPGDLPGRFWRGTPTHSTLSDGVLAPEEVCRRYRDEGYDFLALTDHFVGQFGYPIADTLPFRTNRFTTILGAELHSGAMRNGSCGTSWRWGCRRTSRLPTRRLPAGPGSGDGLRDRAAGVEAGAYVAIAHPQWSGLSLDDARELAPVAHAVETYNHGCAVGCDRPDGFHTLDLLLSEGFRLTSAPRTTRISTSPTISAAGSW